MDIIAAIVLIAAITIACLYYIRKWGIKHDRERLRESVILSATQSGMTREEGIALYERYFIER